MKRTAKNRIQLSNRIYPIFFGLSTDLIFYIIINTLFLSEVKGLSASQINLMMTVSTLVSLFFYLASPKLIKKIGNARSVRLGSLMHLISIILLTFSNGIVFLTIAQAIRGISSVFKTVDAVILNNNLIAENREDDFTKIRSKAFSIYSSATLITSLLSGLLFSINPYIPMIISIVICFATFIMSYFIYEVDTNDKTTSHHDNTEKYAPVSHTQTSSTTQLHLKDKFHFKIHFSIIAIYAIITYGLIYGMVEVCQNNDKLFLQYRLESFLNISEIAIILSITVFLSRIARLLSNLFFNKIYAKLKNKMLILIGLSLIVSVGLFIVGKVLPSAIAGSVIMGIGFIILLTLRDPTENLLTNILLHHSEKEQKEKAILYLQFTRRLVVFALSLFATLILNEYEYIHLYIIFFIIATLYLFVIKKLLALTSCEKPRSSV